jgi:hypothetical protein
MSTATRREQGGNSQGANPGRFRSNQPGTHTHAVRGLDSYPTPRIAVESLLAAEPDVLNTMARVWEPAAGEGNIVRVLRDNGIPVVASDIERYSFDLHFTGDFLQQTQAPEARRTSSRRRRAPPAFRGELPVPGWSCCPHDSAAFGASDPGRCATSLPPCALPQPRRSAT